MKTQVLILKFLFMLSATQKRASEFNEQKSKLLLWFHLKSVSLKHQKHSRNNLSEHGFFFSFDFTELYLLCIQGFHSHKRSKAQHIKLLKK